MKLNFITYGDGFFEKNKKKLLNTAVSSNWFTNCKAFGPETLDENFKNKYKNILSVKRGAGYWLWRPYILKRELNKMAEGDILLSIDAGSTLNIQGKKRFEEYIDILKNNKSGIISFQTKWIEKKYTTQEIFDYFQVDNDSDIANSGQITSLIFLIKNKNTVNLIDKFYNTIIHNPLLFTDHYNNKQHDYFIDNRHEQSVFSVLRKLNNPILINDESWFGEPHGCFNGAKSKNYPFWTSRLSNKDPIRKPCKVDFISKNNL